MNPRRPFLLAPLAVVLTLMTTLPGLTAGTSEEYPDYTVHFQLAGLEPEGAVVLHVQNPEGLAFASRTQLVSDSSHHNPFYRTTIFPDGSGSQYYYWGNSGSNWGVGRGVVYLGLKDSRAEVSGLPTRRIEHYRSEEYEWHHQEAWMTFYWKNQTGPWWFNSSWLPGTTIREVARGIAEAYELKDFEHGARAGVPAAARVHVLDGLTIDPDGGQVLASISITQTDAWGFGHFTVERDDGFHRRLNFVGVHDVVHELENDPLNNCICYKDEEWIFTSTLLHRLRLDYVGDGRSTTIFVVLAKFHETVLPNELWRERNKREPGTSF